MLLMARSLDRRPLALYVLHLEFPSCVSISITPADGWSDGFPGTPRCRCCVLPRSASGYVLIAAANVIMKFALVTGFAPFVAPAIPCVYQVGCARSSWDSPITNVIPLADRVMEAAGDVV